MTSSSRSRSPKAGASTWGWRLSSSPCSRSATFSESSLLEYVDYHFEEPKYDVEECQQRSMTYAAPLKVTLR
jgi:DNA-directed RNA polymerase beta subunit